MTYTEEWFAPESCAALERMVERTEGVTGWIIEIGSWQGRSTAALANAAHPQAVHAVDTWQGSPGELSADLAGGRDVFSEFTANMAAETKGNVVPFRMGWRNYFARTTSPIRLLFIDAEHTYREVVDNIATALPLMSPGGIICGDDAHHPPVQQAVLEHFPNAYLDSTLWWWQAEVAP